MNDFKAFVDKITINVMHRQICTQEEPEFSYLLLSFIHRHMNTDVTKQENKREN